MHGREEAIGEYEARRVQRMLALLYAGHLRPDEAITVTGWIEGGWLCQRWCLARVGHSFVYEVDCRMDLAVNKLPQSTARDLIYDFLGDAFSTYLHGAREPFTGRRWEEIKFADQTLHIRGVERNEAVERAADDLLAEDARRGRPPTDNEA